MNKKIGIIRMIICVILIGFVLICGNEAGASKKRIAIDNKNFSKDMVKYCKEYCDKNNDGYLSNKEINSIKSIYLEEEGTREFDFKGITNFNKLKKIECYGISIKNLPDKCLKKIKSFQIRDSIIDRINLANMRKLESLHLIDVKSKYKIQLPKYMKVKDLKLANVKTNKIDISKYTELEELYVNNGDLCDITKISKNTNLKKLDIVSNIRRLDLRTLKNLEHLWIKCLRCTNIIMPRKSKLWGIHIEAPISYFDISKYTEVESFYMISQAKEIVFGNNKKLEYVYLDAPIEVLDVSKLCNLKDLTLINSSMKTVNINNTNLRLLTIMKGKIVNLDVSSMPKIERIYLEDNGVRSVISGDNNLELTDIDLDNCNMIEEIVVKNNNNINCVGYLTKYNSDADTCDYKPFVDMWDPESGRVSILDGTYSISLCYSTSPEFCL